MAMAEGDRGHWYKCIWSQCVISSNILLTKASNLANLASVRWELTIERTAKGKNTSSGWGRDIENKNTIYSCCLKGNLGALAKDWQKDTRLGKISYVNHNVWDVTQKVYCIKKWITSFMQEEKLGQLIFINYILEKEKLISFKSCII